MTFHRRLTVSVSVAIVLGVAVSAALAQGQIRYRQVEIPGIPEQGFNTVFPADINNHGVIVGSLSRLSGFVPVRAFLWTGSGPTQDLGDLGLFEFAMALGINDANQVIGIAEAPDPRDPLGHVIHGFFWQNGIITELPTLGGDHWSQTDAIIAAGTVFVVSFAVIITDRVR